MKEKREEECEAIETMARETGLEPATSAVTGRRSNQLSYSRGCGQGLHSGARLKGANFPSQGYYKSPRKSGTFAAPMRKMACFQGKTA